MYLVIKTWCKEKLIFRTDVSLKELHLIYLI